MSSQNKCWGLYVKDTANAVPLKNLDVSIKIYQNVARVIYSQEYVNNNNVLLETEFLFPISPDACFDSFEATFNNTTIKGIVKEKEKAKEEYKQAVEEGRTAAYSEINKETGDIMKVMIGNIPPNTNIKVTYSYLQKLETSLNKFWCFRLFSTLTPRYNNMSNLQDFLNHDVNVLTNYPTVSKNSSDAYPWTIQAEIHSPSPITFIKSPSHDIKTTYGNENHTCNVTLNPNTKHFPNKDFVLLFSNGTENKIDYLMTPFEDGYCAMVSLLADFEKSSTEDAFNNFVKAKEVENLYSMDTIRGEYIFLIDRSGSMEGDRITMARTSLALFLKSLPKDSYFNVVSFGSSYDFLYPQSKQYSQESIDSSTQQVQRFEANMGGTEIYGALSKIFSTPPQNGYPRFVFLLTDGAVSNTQRVLDLIMENSDKTRTFTIGIGNGCSPELINKGAAYGRGKAEFVTDNSQTFEKVISLLNASLSPCYSDLSLHADNFDAIVKSVSPSPDSIPFLINGQTATFFLFLRSAAFDGSQKMNLQLRMNDSRTQKHKTIDIVLDTAEAFENDMIPKLGIYDMIKRLETQKDQVSGNKKAKDIMWIVKEDLEKTMTEYSLKYGILCKETAFFCEIADNETNTKNVLPTKVIVPTTLSHDYEGQERFRSLCSSYRSAPTSTLSSTSTSFATFGASPSNSMNMNLSRRSEDKCAAPPMMMMKCSAAPPQSSGGFFRGMASGISNAVGSLFSSNSSNSSAPQKEYKEEKRMKKTSTLKESAPSPTHNSFQRNYAPPTGSASVSTSSLQSKSVPVPSGGSYLDIIMKQQFEGCWDSNDNSLQQTILKDGKLSQLPSQIQITNSSQASAVWITILVLRWLELVCKDDRKAWLLIFQKGCDWLKLQGVDYDTVKDIGTASIKV